MSPGNFKPCHVLRPKNYKSEAALPCMVYAHGGGGVFMTPHDYLNGFRYAVANIWKACIILPKYDWAPEVKQPEG